MFTELFSGWTKQKFAQLRMGSRHLNLTGLYPLRVSSISASVAEAIFCFSEISSDSTLLDDKISMADSSSKMLPWKQNSLVTSTCILYKNMLNIQLLVFYPSMYAQLLVKLYYFSERCQHHASFHVYTGGMHFFQIHYLNLTSRSYLLSTEHLAAFGFPKHYCPLIPHSGLPWHQGGIPCIRPREACALTSSSFSQTTPFVLLLCSTISQSWRFVVTGVFGLRLTTVLWPQGLLEEKKNSVNRKE